MAIIYADSSLLESYRYPALNQADWPSCKQLATEQGWEYTETKVSDWQYWTKVQYTGNAIQVRIPGYTGNQSLNYDNLADNFDFLATIPENGALVINSTSSYMYDANPNAAISYSTVQKDEDLNDFIIGCVNR